MKGMIRLLLVSLLFGIGLGKECGQNDYEFTYTSCDEAGQRQGIFSINFQADLHRFSDGEWPCRKRAAIAKVDFLSLRKDSTAVGIEVNSLRN
jgi:hypothetical protein